MAQPQPSPRSQREGLSVQGLPDHLLCRVFRLAPAADLPVGAPCRPCSIRSCRPCSLEPPSLMSTLPMPARLQALRLTCRAFLAPATEAATRLQLRRGSGGSPRGSPRAAGPGSLRLASFPFLIELDASEAAGEWSESWLLEAAAAAPALESLKLGRLPALSSRGAAALAALPRLARLELGGCGLSDGALAGALGALGGLREADLSMCAHLGDATLAALAAGCPRLAKLDLTGCERVRCALLLFIKQKMAAWTTAAAGLTAVGRMPPHVCAPSHRPPACAAARRGCVPWRPCRCARSCCRPAAS